MRVAKVGWLALALTTGCLRFGYGATDADRDAAQRDAGAPSRDGGVRDGGTFDAAVSSNGGMDGGAVQPDAAYAGSATDAAPGGAGSSAAADSGLGEADAAADNADASIDTPGTDASIDASGTDASIGAPGTDASIAAPGTDAGIDVNQMVGTTGLRVKDVLGYYTSTAWGDMVLQAHGAEIWATYPLNDGTIVGDITSAGVLAGWWAETPSRIGRNAGEVELRFSQNSGTVKLVGRWRYQTSGAWYANWDLDLVTNRSPPSALIDAFNYPENFRRHP